MMQRFVRIAAMLVAALPPFAAAKDAPPERWIAYYGNALPAENFLAYETIVFDADTHPPLVPLLYRNKKLLAYVSMAEVLQEKPYRAALEEKGLLMGKNTVWGGHYIDLRNPEWARIVIEEIVPPLIQQGFNGLMLDTLDSAAAMEAEDPERHAGMKRAAAELVKAIRYQYPDLTLMANRGFDILPQIEGDIDILLAESVYVSYDFKEKTFARVPEDIYAGLVRYFAEAKARAPKLKIYTLDYWKENDAEGVKAIYAAQRANGFTPYVATSLNLDRLDAEPK